LNWGLVGVGMLVDTNLNIVNWLLGPWPIVEAIVYVIVGLATIAVLTSKKCKSCMVGSSM